MADKIKDNVTGSLCTFHRGFWEWPGRTLRLSLPETGWSMKFCMATPPSSGSTMPAGPSWKLYDWPARDALSDGKKKNKQPVKTNSQACSLLPSCCGVNRLHSSSLTCDRNNVEKPPHGLRADVTEPVFTHQQLGEVKGHLSGDSPLHLPAPVSIL